MRRVALFALPMAVLLAVGTPRPAAAAIHDVVVTLDPGPGAAFAGRVGVDLPALQMQLKQEIEQMFQLYRVDDYLRSFADAQAFSTKGLGADYASNIDYFMIGAAANVALNADRAYLENPGSGEPAVKAAATNVTIMGGVNLGLIGLHPLTIYGNWFRGNGSYREFDTTIDNFGGHVQLKLLAPDRHAVLDSLVRWGGFDITTGFDYAHQRMNLAQARTLTRSIDVGAPQANAQVEMQGMGTFQLDLKTWTIPLELTTNVRLLQLASVYGGVGFDWQLGGNAEMQVAVDAKMLGSVPSQNVKDQELGTVRITATGDTTPSKARLRGLAGVQFNVLVVKIFAQLNYSPELETASVAFGARLAY